MRKNRRILVVVAHPDDEVLGCGGTIARHVDEGSEVTLFVLTDGVGARGESTESSHIRSLELRESARVLGITSVIQDNLPDNKLDSIPLLEVTHKIAPILDEVRPHIIYTHFLYDLNQDHSAIASAVRVLTRPSPLNVIEAVLMMEVHSSTEWAFGENSQFSPNYFIALNERQMDLKVKALSKYVSELREPPHPRRVEHARIAAQYRGAQSGCKYSEAFMLLRSVN